MRKNPPRTNKMEPKAPKVLSRYLNAPTASCHDHCKGATKEQTDTKPIRRIPKAPPDRTKTDASNSINRIKKAPSVVPKITTRNVKNNNVVKDPILKSRDLKPKSENSQATKKCNPPNSTTSRRRHSDIFLPNEDIPLPSSRVLPKRRLSEIGIHPKKDVVSVSNTSMVRGSRTNKNEPGKDTKLSSVNKKSNSSKPMVPSPIRGAKVATLRSYKSLPQSDLKSLTKSKPRKPIENVALEKTSHVIEPNSEVGNTKTESHVTLDSSPSFEEKTMTHGHKGLVEGSSLMEDDGTTATNGQDNQSVADSEVTDSKDGGKLVVETTDCCTKTESNIIPNSSPSNEENSMTNGDNGLQECSSSMEDDSTTATNGQDNKSVADSEVIDSKDGGKLVVEITDCCTKTESNIIPNSSPSNEENSMTDGDNRLQECSSSMEDDSTTATNGQHNQSVADIDVIDSKDGVKLVVETTDCCTKTESNITPSSSPSNGENSMTYGDNGLQECSLLMEDDTIAKDGQQNGIVADSEGVDTKEETSVGKLLVETSDCSLDDLIFKRGNVLSPHSEGSTPRKQQFREEKELDDNETEKFERICLRRMSYDGVIRIPESQPVSVDLKHQEMVEKESPSLFNKVLEETANKLIQTRKSKVKALVGAFENIVSATSKSP
ncbi:hypothetical protein L2E82_16963 [Cichorium intybus]|uniref:Uncharacterized protein n=1 Tax=Cichorium intybus TaxID=13427 RepID=A0ACB9F7I3_CICIN|nr:hypothetical protein L2E82_16963 [Cichorium intybus]